MGASDGQGSDSAVGGFGATGLFSCVISMPTKGPPVGQPVTADRLERTQLAPNSWRAVQHSVDWCRADPAPHNSGDIMGI
jgi:hypothetical protein